jgi:NitT/TauT family transport system substrate-binding protein
MSVPFSSKLLRTVAALGASLLGLVIPLAIPMAAHAADTVTLRLDFLPQGYHAPLFYGVAKGFYEAQGITLQIGDGKGSTASLQSVAAGNDMIVLANYSTMLQSIAEGIPLVAIGGLIQRVPDAIIALKGSGIKTPKDMEGKTMSIPPTSAIFKMFPAFATAAGVDISKIKLIQMTPAATQTALLQGQVDFTTGWAFTQGVAMAKMKPIEEPMMIADYGITLLGAGFVVRQDTAAAKKDILKRFMAATAKSFDEGMKNPVAANDALFAARPQIDKEASLEMLRLFPPYLSTQQSKGHPFGWMAKEDWEKTVDILRTYFDLKTPVDLNKAYTNEFVSGL